MAKNGRGDALTRAVLERVIDSRGTAEQAMITLVVGALLTAESLRGETDFRDTLRSMVEWSRDRPQRSKADLLLAAAAQLLELEVAPEPDEDAEPVEPNDDAVTIAMLISLTRAIARAEILRGESHFLRSLAIEIQSCESDQTGEPRSRASLRQAGKLLAQVISDLTRKKSLPSREGGDQ